MNTYKVVLLGDMNVGKSSVTCRFIYNDFKEKRDTTIGASYYRKVVPFGKKEMALEIWDTAGQERFSSLIPMYYRGARAAIIIYDITNIKSFEKCPHIINQVKNNIGNSTGIHSARDIIIMLVGNKKDLNKDRVITYNQGSALALEYNILFEECSAATGENINDIFQLITTKLGILTPTTERTLLIPKDSSSTCCH